MDLNGAAQGKQPTGVLCQLQFEKSRLAKKTKVFEKKSTKLAV
jgi:hypothetical protein